MTRSDDDAEFSVLPNWFLGPRAEFRQDWEQDLQQLFQDYAHWRRNYSYDDPPIARYRFAEQSEEWHQRLDFYLGELTASLKAHYPFYSPRYIAHMVSETTTPAVLGYFAAMLYNPNNVSTEAAPITVDYELEVGRMISAMLGYDPEAAWAHITGGGTVANLEALWVARTAKFVPLILKDFVEKCRADRELTSEFEAEKLARFEISLPGKADGVPISRLEFTDLLDLAPQEIHAMEARFRDWCAGHEIGAAAGYREHFFASDYNPNMQGMYAVLSRLGRTPVLLASESCHYCIPKTLNLLGLGEAQLERIPLDSRFRLSAEGFRECLFDQGEDRTVLAGVAVIGATETGAVDPIHEVIGLRGTYETERNRSFWLHADAAWGGYVASLFWNGSGARHTDKPWQEWETDDIARMSSAARLRRRTANDQEVAWENGDLYRAFHAIGEADSIIIDPHKLGYVPYPAGAVCFRDRTVTSWISQDAPYIGEDDAGNIGHVVLEGSKPGAAAAACWLAHKTIPLNMSGHGRIIRETVLNARTLWSYLEETCREPEDVMLVPISVPDTNIVCFVASPADLAGLLRTSGADPWALLNAINREIHGELSIEAKRQVGPDAGRRGTPQSLPFFVSRTELSSKRYSLDCVAETLDRLGLPPGQFAEHDLFVLRSTVMSPWYSLARKGARLAGGGGRDTSKHYLRDFVSHLLRLARQAVERRAPEHG